MFKALLRVVTTGRAVRTVLVGVGGGVLTAIGWKIGTDIYELVKRRMRDDKDAEAVPAATESKPEVS